MSLGVPRKCTTTRDDGACPFWLHILASGAHSVIWSFFFFSTPVEVEEEPGFGCTVSRAQSQVVGSLPFASRPTKPRLERCRATCVRSISHDERGPVTHRYFLPACTHLVIPVPGTTKFLFSLLVVVVFFLGRDGSAVLQVVTFSMNRAAVLLSAACAACLN